MTLGECPMCRQGTLELYRAPVADVLVIICDDCEAQWLDPNDAAVGCTPLQDEFQTLVPASEEEARAAGWDV